ncbi:MAG TPA: ATP-binding protein, partial [Myxococcales bacterium]
EIEVMAAGARVVFFVTDHGPGIAPGDRDRVFDRFVQLDQSLTRSQGGLGLGLYLCRLVALAHDGGVALRDEPGWATSFVARLPVEARRISDDSIPRVSRAANA